MNARTSGKAQRNMFVTCFEAAQQISHAGSGNGPLRWFANPLYRQIAAAIATPPMQRRFFARLLSPQQAQTNESLIWENITKDREQKLERFCNKCVKVIFLPCMPWRAYQLPLSKKG